MKTNRIQKQMLLLILPIFIVFSLVPTLSHAEEKIKTYSNEEIKGVIEGIVNWKKESIGSSAQSPLFNNTFLESAGETVGDWYSIGIGRIGYADQYDAYLAVMKDKVSKRYTHADKLSKTKSTEWHRISLAILAMGGDPTKIALDASGDPINLIADGTFNRGKTISLGAQGINGWIWGLITLDSMRYTVPEDASYTRDDIIKEILQLQLADGGFSFFQDKIDPDITGMAIQALASYYNSEQLYTYKQKAIGKTVTKTVRQVIEESLVGLSKLQLADGDFESWGAENVESTTQVLVALTALGKDPLQDKRFIKNGNTLVDGILKYRNEDGGFIHSKVYNPANPTSLPDESNSMASEQALYALVSLYRFNNGYRSLYDFRSEIEGQLKEKIAYVKESIDTLPKKITKANKKQIETIFDEYLQIPISERSYIYNYSKLSGDMKELGIKNTSEPIAANLGITEHGNGTITPLFNQATNNDANDIFSAEDVKKATSLSKNVTTESYIDVVKLLEKLEKAKNRDEYEGLLETLKIQKTKIEEIKVEIESLNKEILDKLYPFNNLSIKDKKNVEEIVSRFQKLSDYDQKKILNYEDVKKAKTQVDNLIRARMITVIIIVVVVIIIFSIVWRFKKKKKEKGKQMMLDLDDES